MEELIDSLNKCATEIRSQMYHSTESLYTLQSSIENAQTLIKSHPEYLGRFQADVNNTNKYVRLMMNYKSNDSNKRHTERFNECKKEALRDISDVIRKIKYEPLKGDTSVEQEP